MKFSVAVDGYQDQGGMRVPTGVRAVWHLPEGEFEYWRGTIREIHFDVRE